MGLDEVFLVREKIVGVGHTTQAELLSSYVDEILEENCISHFEVHFVLLVTKSIDPEIELDFQKMLHV